AGWKSAGCGAFSGVRPGITPGNGLIGSASAMALFSFSHCHPGRAPLGARAGIHVPVSVAEYWATWVPDRLAWRYAPLAVLARSAEMTLPKLYKSDVTGARRRGPGR